MFDENGHKRTFLEALVKDYNTKNKNSDNCNDTIRKKIPSIPNIGPNRSYYLIVLLECTSWIVHAMADILANQRKKYRHVALNIIKAA